MKGRFTCQESLTYRMPVHFREMKYNLDNRVVYRNVMSFSVEQKTDGDALAKYVPSDFEITSPSILWGYVNCRDVDFMAHGEYRIFQATVPVRYEKNGQAIDGVYPLVIFENDATPILGGREEDGMPKVYCDIAGERHHENHWFANASLYCDTMLRMDFHEAEPIGAQALEALNVNPLTNNFGYRYIPQVGAPGAATSGPVLYPQEVHPETGWTGEMSVEVRPPRNWYENFTLYATLKALHDLPNHGFVNGMRMVGSLRLCVADSKAL